MLTSADIQKQEKRKKNEWDKNKYKYEKKKHTHTECVMGSIAIELHSKNIVL